MDTQAESGVGIALPESMIDLATFRACMRQVPGAVTVITTVHEGTRGGLTATAVCSVSAEPPQMLVCVNRSSSAEAVIVAAGRFGVSYLSHEQEAVANAFSASLDNRFDHGDWVELESGVPLLKDAAVAFDCKIVQTITAGTHTIFIGAIVAAVARDVPNLVYKAGAYGKI
ncbi:flavin reductase family protein [Acidisphaera sp. L21]|uniref:flavin reductase family protein n=1 Tax=Acidisphaera sp. L21 TaxID=1641851 RepID=UPI00131CF318|nr:flavin reductase family protein [Acidisphaera sp. L21]